MNELYEDKQFKRALYELMPKHKELLDEVVAEAKASGDKDALESAYADMEQIGEVLEVLVDVI